MTKKIIKQTVWTAELDNWLRELYPVMHVTAVSRAMGLSWSRVNTRAKKIGLLPISVAKAQKPGKSAWVKVVNETAVPLGISPRDVIQGARRHEVCKARWLAWKSMLDQYPSISIMGLARVTGFDHTTVMHGMARLNGMPPCFGRAPGYSRATKRRPSLLGAAA